MKMNKCRYYDKCEHKTGWCASDTTMLHCTYAIPFLKEELEHKNYEKVKNYETETIDKINKFTRRPFTEDEVYVFSVVLCDNEVDRDGERFSDKALEELKDRFVGKTGIFDHDPTTSNQNARIFDTEVITDTSRTTTYGAAYKYLKASAYMVRTTENKNLIAEIDGGIKKEVSISCSAAKRICSICGCNKNKGSCSHEKWKSYGTQKCHTILSDIADAYEWSFVSVPIPIVKTKRQNGNNYCPSCGPSY